MTAPRSTGRAAALAVLLAVLLAVPGGARAQALVADLSNHLIAITTGFTGTEVLLFGAVEEPGDVIVVVRGPVGDVAVRRKDRLAGIWVNRGRMDFVDVPSFYAVAANRPLYEIANPALLARHGIGVDFLRLAPEEDPQDGSLRAFREALVRIKMDDGLYARQVAQVSFLGQRLFRATVSFPANVPTGSYLVEVLLVRDGEVVSAQTTPLIISKIGIGADIFDFAHNQAALHGVVAILIALMAGWIAHLVFRRI
ncbi:MAG: hypothetical protein BroJett029_17690 [Alphaproteobacteria bacterium]|nr:MAG: hypothetical protein BroJett029_17690 [Alphaproteobacteria bacterium]